jgi:S1-C subfamily serine protease
MALIPPAFLDSVVAIGFGDDPAARGYVATGFLYGRRADETGYNVFLVTNRHVFVDQSAAWLRFNPEGGLPAREYRIPLKDGEGREAWHSTDGVDLAVIGINAGMLTEHKIRFFFFEGDNHVLTLEQAKNEGISEGDGVFALGFPMGLVGGDRNFVIVRMGAIARISDALERASKEILVDIAIFPGNSGGPVITRPEVVSVADTKAFNRAALLGVVASYVPYQDVAISTQTRRPRVIFEENSGLASIVPVDELVALVDGAAEKMFSKAVPPEVDPSEATPSQEEPSPN